MNYFKGLALGTLMFVSGLTAYGKGPEVYRCTDELGNRGFKIELGDKLAGGNYMEKVDAAEEILNAEMARAGVKKRLMCAPRSVEGNTVYIHPWYLSKKQAKFLENTPETDC